VIEKVLIADDESLMLRFVKTTLERLGKAVTTCSDGKEAIARLEQEHFDLIISDIQMPEKTGLDVLEAAKRLAPSCPVILATAYGTIETAVEAMKKGAFHYLIKPFSAEALESVVQKADEHVRLLKENLFLREENAKLHYPHLIAESESMKKLLIDIEKIAKSHASVFITGESGTGKEVISSIIHQLSPRAKAPFVKVNCAAVPETLVESEFFGHEKGAFTGALQRKIGRFELADQGTLLLDEVTEIPIALQPKLLRAIQEQEFERIGSPRSLKVNIRFLATSNRNLQEAIEGKIFREDLFYRLNVIPLHIPPLRDRPEDIIPLARSFLRKFAIENHQPLKALTSSASAKLTAYPWPGNVRELANVMERTAVLSNAEMITAEHLDILTTETKRSFSLRSLHEMEKEWILETLEKFHKNRTQTANSLGISVRTLRNKLHEYGMAEQD
jgi:two-component system response regulator AtoC